MKPAGLWCFGLLLFLEPLATVSLSGQHLMRIGDADAVPTGIHLAFAGPGEITVMWSTRRPTSSGARWASAPRSTGPAPSMGPVGCVVRRGTSRYVEGALVWWPGGVRHARATSGWRGGRIALTLLAYVCGPPPSRRHHHRRRTRRRPTTPPRSPTSRARQLRHHFGTILDHL